METKGRGLFGRDFTLVLLGQVVSLFGSAVLRFALPLYLLGETGSPALFGAVGAAALVPAVVCAPIGGAVADRVDKGRMMAGLDFATAALVGGYGLLLGRAPLAALTAVCLMALYGIAGAYQPAVQASIPLLAEPGALTRANAVVNMVGTLSGLLGPVLGGVVLGAFGIRPVVWMGAACFFLSAVMELFLRIPFQPRERTGGLLAAVRGDLGAGWRFVRRERPVYLGVMAVLALFNLALSAALMVGIPVAVSQALGLGEARLGITQGAMGLGGLLGGALMAVLSRALPLRRGSAVLLGAALTAGGMGLALAPGMPPLTAWGLLTALSFGMMALSALLTVVLCAAVQSQTPPELLGKVMALLMAACNCASPLGQVLYGQMFQRLPVWMPFAASALAGALIALGSRRTFCALEEGGAV